MLPSPPSTRMRSSPPGRRRHAVARRVAGQRPVLDDLAGRHQHLDAGLLQDREDRGEGRLGDRRLAVGHQQHALHRARRLDADRLAAAAGRVAAHPPAPRVDRVDEGLAVALRAGQAGVGRPQHPAALPLDGRDDPAHRVLPRLGIPHHAARADALAPHLELRLHQHHRTPARGEAAPHRGPDRADRDEREVTGGEVRRPGEHPRAAARARWCAP